MGVPPELVVARQEGQEAPAVTGSRLARATDQPPVTAGRDSPRGTLAAVAAPEPALASDPPGRGLLRVVGALTQLICGSCLLIGTIGLVLVHQHKADSLGLVAVWLAMAMAGLVFGGLIYRGGLASMLLAAGIDAGFGIALNLFDDATLNTLLKILPPADIATIGVGLRIAGYAMIGAGVLCLIALPQGVRYARWFRTAAATRNAMSTARGFPPPPVPARGPRIPPPRPQIRRARRPSPRTRRAPPMGRRKATRGPWWYRHPAHRPMPAPR